MSQQGAGPDGLNLAQEAEIEGAIREVRRIADPETSAHVAWEQRLHIARTAITIFNSTGFSQMPNRTTDRTFVVAALQRVAYHEAEGAGVVDVAEWCMNQWLSLLQRNAEDLHALRGKSTYTAYQSVITTYIILGLGQAWLCRSQNVLARIHRAEGSSSSGSSGRARSLSDRLVYTSSEEARDTERATAEADARAHTADYVEARGMLIPAVEYFSRAVTLAERDGLLSGELLAEVKKYFLLVYIHLTYLPYYQYHDKLTMNPPPSRQQRRI